MFQAVGRTWWRITFPHRSPEPAPELEPLSRGGNLDHIAPSHTSVKRRPDDLQLMPTHNYHAKITVAFSAGSIHAYLDFSRSPGRLFFGTSTSDESSATTASAARSLA